MPDTNIQAAIAECEAILKKRDLTGLLFISSKSHTHFALALRASWSCVFTETDEQHRARIRFRSRRADYPSLEAQKASVAATIGALMGFLDAGGRALQVCKEIIETIGKKIPFTHISRQE